METNTYVLTIPNCPKSVNAGGGGSRRHWSVSHAEKLLWEDIFGSALWIEKVPKRMSRCTVDIVVRFKNRNRRDIENLRHPIVKPFADILVKGKWLPDDTDEFFKVTDMRFEYPEQWTARNKVELVLKLEATYA